ncbi:MAG: HEAT repeat domain-containing protein [Pseudomonadota bacterium]
MEIEEQLRAALAPRKPRPELRVSILALLSARGGSARNPGRTRSRTILLGTVLAVAAAAAILAVVLQDGPEPQVAAELPLAVPAAPAVAVEEAKPAEQAASVAAPEQVKAEPEEILPPPTPFTVRMLPLQNSAVDVAAKAAIDTFYASFLDGLRTVPGLSLVISDVADPVDDLIPDFELTVRGGGPMTGNKFVVGVAGDDKWMISARKKSGLPRSQGSAFAFSFSGDIVPTCVPGSPGCITPSSAAAYALERFSKTKFPANPALLKKMRAQLLDVSLDPQVRLKILTDLDPLGGRSASSLDGFKTLGAALSDAAIVNGAIALATATPDPAIRAQVWRAMRSSRNPELVKPLIASLQKDLDSEVRLQAVATLQEDFANDPAARAALESVAQEESRPLVRALAQRALSGDAAWTAYVFSTLKDSRRSDTERLEAFMYHMYPPGRTPGSFNSSNRISQSQQLLDDEAIASLAYLLPKAATSTQFKGPARFMINDLSRLKQAGVTSVLLSILEQTDDPDVKYSIVGQMGQRSSEPAVQAAMKKISVEDQDPQLRSMAAKVLQPSPAN